MNYKSQLRAWAIDRALEWSKKADAQLSLDELCGAADRLLTYAYVAREHIDELTLDIFEAIAKGNPSDKLGEMRDIELLKSECELKIAANNEERKRYGVN